MKIAIETHDLMKRFDERTVFSILKKAGFDGVDFSFFWLHKEKNEEVLGAHYLEYANKTKTLLDEFGLSCNQAHAPFSFNIKQDCLDEGNEHYLEIVRAIRSASVMGAKIIVVHPQYAAENESSLQTNIRFYKSLERYAAESKIKIGVENIFPSKMQDERLRPLGDRFAFPQSMQEIMAILGTEHFAVCLDVGHSALVGVEPQDFIASLDNQTLQAVHIHDNNYVDDQHLLPFMGKIAWGKVVDGLKRIDYQGDFTLEVPAFLSKFDDSLIVDAVQFAEKIAKQLTKGAGEV